MRAHDNRRDAPGPRDRLKLIVTFVAAYALGHMSNSIISHRHSTSASPRRRSSIAPRYSSLEEEHANATLSYVPTNDPYLEPLNCLDLLDSYQREEIPQLGKIYRKSYVRLTSTPTPFYISTHDGEVDRMRVEVFDTGDYYETVTSSSIRSILDEESERVHRGSKRSEEKRRPIMLDVGSNIGWFGLLGAAHGAEVYAFEPNVANAVRFCESLLLNGWAPSSNPAHNRVHPFLRGVGDVHGVQRPMYKVDPKNPGSFSFSEEAAAAGAALYGPAEVLEGEPLRLVTLDALAEDQGWLADDDDNAGGAPIAILKIDVEGLELSVLRGARKLLKSKKVRNVFLELKSELSLIHI